MPFSFGYTKQRLTLENLMSIYLHIIIIAVRLKEDMDETKGPAFQLIFFFYVVVSLISGIAACLWILNWWGFYMVMIRNFVASLVE